MVERKSSMDPSQPRGPGHGLWRLSAIVTALVAIVGSGAVAYGAFIEPRLLEVVQVKVPVPRLPLTFDGTRIVHISDLHVGRFVGREQIRVAVDRVNGLNPDIVAITGDMVHSVDGEEMAILEEELARLSAPLGVYAVLGNHDHWTDADTVSGALRRAGVTVLRNSATTVTRGGETMAIAGVDDAVTSHANLSAAMASVSPDTRVILLAHEPDFADTATADPRVALQLSGHSHGGQVCIPCLPRILPRLAHKYPSGLYQVEDLWLYTNRGIGTAYLPIRFNCRPEVTVVELAAQFTHHQDRKP